MVNRAEREQRVNCNPGFPIWKRTGTWRGLVKRVGFFREYGGANPTRGRHNAGRTVDK